MGRGVYLGISHSSHPKIAKFKGSPVLEVLLNLCLHPLIQNNQTRRGDTHGEGRVLEGQPRHCICTNVSRGLSATAEFLVFRLLVVMCGEVV